MCFSIWLGFGCYMMEVELMVVIDVIVVVVDV